jgi:hypothetical protein
MSQASEFNTFELSNS